MKKVSFKEQLELFASFLKIGAFTFGGGYAMIPIIENECVSKKQWLSSDEFMDLTVIAESTPGPIAINCATYVGYRRGGFFGALFATLGVVAPSFMIILLISFFLDDVLKYPVVEHAFIGIRCAVAVLIARAGFKMLRQLLSGQEKNAWKFVFALAFFLTVIVLNFLNLDFSVIYLMLASGFFGFFVFRERRAEP